MPELRRDPVVGSWVIVATERARRPTDYRIEHQLAPAGGLCPFCPGHEDRTGHEVLAYRPHDGPGARPDAPGWSLRAFPNRFPALMVEGDLDRAGDGLYDYMNGIGAHEVIVETPDHARQLSQLGDEEVARVLRAYRDRIADLRNDVRFRYVMAFKNHGFFAGATIEHSHSQVIALPMVPKQVNDELAGAREHYQLKERCIYCDIARQELSQRARLVYENPECVVFAPWASRFPFELWLVPRRHRVAFEDTPEADFLALGAGLRVALRKLSRALDDPPYNFVVHGGPLREPNLPYYHWHIEIVPALTRVAGFELGSGFHINATAPEEAARFLRELPES